MTNQKLGSDQRHLVDLIKASFSDELADRAAELLQSEENQDLSLLQLVGEAERHLYEENAGMTFEEIGKLRLNSRPFIAEDFE